MCRMASRLRRHHPNASTRVLRTTIAVTGKAGKHEKISPHSKRSNDNNNSSKRVLRPQQDKDRPPTVPVKKRGRPSGPAVVSSVQINYDERIPLIPELTTKAEPVSSNSSQTMENSLPPVRKVERLQPLRGTRACDESTWMIGKRHEKPEKEEKRIVREDRIWMNERIWRDRLLKKKDAPPPAPEYVLMVVRDKPPRSLILK